MASRFDQAQKMWGKFIEIAPPTIPERFMPA